MKNGFYFTLKALFVLEMFTFLPWLFGYVEKRLDKKAMVNFNILPNVSRSKGNQVIRFGQLIKYSMRNIFLQKSCRKWGRGTSSRPLFVFQKSFIQGWSKWSASYFSFILVDHNLDMQLKTNYITFQTVDPRDILSFDFL